MTDKIPIGEISFVGPDYYHVMIRLKDEKLLRHKAGDIITLDMIEPYESEAVRKVAEYIRDSTFPDDEFIIQYAREIVKLVHEAEDADE